MPGHDALEATRPRVLDVTRETPTECCGRLPYKINDNPWRCSGCANTVQATFIPVVSAAELQKFAEWVERDRNEPDKLLCHVSSMRRAVLDARP